jgi:hypothetical protein
MGDQVAQAPAFKVRPLLQVLEEMPRQRDHGRDRRRCLQIECGSCAAGCCRSGDARMPSVRFPQAVFVDP